MYTHNERETTPKRSGLIVFTLVAGCGLTAATQPPAVAQEPNSQATIAALETQVAGLQTQVAELSPPSAAGVSTAQAPDAGGLSTFLFGDAVPAAPQGESEVVAVVSVGNPDASSVPLVVRNNTAGDVELEGVFGLARDDVGALLLSGDVSMVAPTRMGPGEIAVGYVYFGEDVPADAVLEFEPQWEPYEDRDFGKQDLEILEAAVSESAIVGIARNPLEEDLSGPFSVVGLCFDEGGAIQGYFSTYAAKDELTPGETTPFSADYFGDVPCGTFLVGSSGYKDF